MSRHVAVASSAAVDLLAEVNRTRVVRAVGFASTTLPDGVTYYWAVTR